MHPASPARAATAVSARTDRVCFIMSWSLYALSWVYESESEIDAEQHGPERRAALIDLRCVVGTVARAEARLRIPPLIVRPDEGILHARVHSRALRRQAAGQAGRQRVAQRNVADANERALLVVARARVRAETREAGPRLRATLILRRPVVRLDVAEPSGEVAVRRRERIVDGVSDARRGEGGDVEAPVGDAIVQAPLPPREVVVPSDERAVVRRDPAVAVHVSDADGAGLTAAHRARERGV